MKTNRVSEKGQALVFLVLGFVAFLGFVALAIDGGMAYSDHRNSQNASDAASLAGGGAAALVLDNNHVTWGNWSCTSNPDVFLAMAAAEAAAIDRAGSNQFTIDQDRGDQNGVTAECFEVPLGSFTDKYIDVTTEISMTTTTSFAQLLFPGGLNNRVLAVTRVRPRTPLAYGNAIVALNEAPCSGNSNGVVFGGSSDIDIIGGGVWSNGCLRGNGGQFTVDVENGGVSYVGETSGEMDNINPPPEPQPEPLPPASYQVPPPNCSDPSAYQHADIVLNNGTLEMEPGLHCVSGRIRINGGTFTGTGVTFYVTGSGVTINGNAVVQLNAPAEDPDPSPAIPGVLFYVPNGDVSLEGTGQSWFLGLVYVPNGTIEVIGTGDVDQTFHTQLIGHDVYVSGNARIDIIFNESEEYHRPAYIELAR